MAGEPHSRRGPAKNGRMHIVVWIDDWQMQCCGTPFEEGDEIAWTLAPALGDRRPPDLLGDDTAGRITHVEDHHGILSDQTPVTRGTVRSIEVAFCRFVAERSAGDGRVLRPVPGSQLLRPVRRATGREEAAGLRFVGYVVEVRAADAAN